MVKCCEVEEDNSGANRPTECTPFGTTTPHFTTHHLAHHPTNPQGGIHQHNTPPYMAQSLTKEYSILSPVQTNEIK